jgi:hypothetical protein
MSTRAVGIRKWYVLRQIVDPVRITGGGWWPFG